MPDDATSVMFSIAGKQQQLLHSSILLDASALSLERHVAVAVSAVHQCAMCGSPARDRHGSGALLPSITCTMLSAVAVMLDYG